MKGIGKRLIAVLAALALALSVFPLGSPAVEVKADDPQATNFVVTTSQDETTDAIDAARLWYLYKDQIQNPENYTTWSTRRNVVITSVFKGDPNDFNPDGSTAEGRAYWEKIDRFVFDEVTVDTTYFNQNYATERLVVASGGSITIGENDEHSEAGTTVIRVMSSASVDGRITLEGTKGKEGILELGNGATLTICKQGLISTTPDKYGYIFVKEGASVIDYDSHPVEITVDEARVIFNSEQSGNYYLYNKNGTWVGKKGPSILTEVTLPIDEESFRYTIDDWYGNKSGRTLYECNDGTPRTESEADPDEFVVVNGEKRALPLSFDKVTIDCPSDEYSLCEGMSITNLEVSEGSTLKIVCKTNDQNPEEKWTCGLDVNNATIYGDVIIEGADAGLDENNNPFTNRLMVYNELRIGENGSVQSVENANFELGWDDPVDIYVNELDQLDFIKEIPTIKKGQKVYVGGNAYRATLGTETVVFDGQQTKNYKLVKDQNTGWKVLGAVSSVVLPRDEDLFWFTIDDYYSDKPGSTPKQYFENGDEKPAVFDTVTIDGNFPLTTSIFANKLIVTNGSTLTLEKGGDTYDYYWEYENDDGEWVREQVFDGSGNPVIVTDEWGGQIVVDNVEIAGSVKIEPSDAIWYEKRDQNGDPDLTADYGPSINYLQINNELKITEESGSIEITGNGELSFGEYFDGLQQVIDIPSTGVISTETPFVVNPFTTIKVNDEIYTIHVKSGNPYDTAEHDGFVFDGVMNYGWARFATTTNGGWELKDEDGEPFAVWWGAPFENEYRVYFKKGSVKIGGSEFTTNSFHSYTKGTPIEIELVPPTDFTGTPIVFINGGYYNIGEDYMRSDDFKTSDLWWENPATVTKLEVKDNKFTYTPKTDEGIEIYVYYDPEDIMYDAMYFVDRAYLNYGEFREDGNYYFYPDRVYNPNAGEPGQEGNTEFGLQAAWAYPGSEFMVEVTQNNSNGTVEMTPGIDFYRVGNKVKALYQGFEILGGNSVEVKFKPASGYDLLAVTIDGTSYSPSAAGMTSSGGVYTLTIDETPTVKDATLNGLYSDKFRENDYVKIKKITATFGIKYTPSYDDGGSTSGGTSGGTEGGTTSGGSTDAVTPGTDDGTTSGGSGASEEAEPEVQRQTTTTDKADDGTQTTTTSTTYTDGSKVTEKVVEKPDGSSTATTTTTEADGTKVVEKVEEKADGSSKATTTTTETDGTKKTETVEKKVDGTEVTTNTVKDADGNSTTEKVEKKKDGTVTTTNTTKDADGASTTEKVVEKPDGSVTTTSTEKDADGNVLSTSKVVEKTKEDGTKTITATEKNADGSSSTSKTTINTDGSSKTNTTTQNADGSTTKEKITEKADGSLTRTATTTDENGNVLATEKEKVTVSKSGTETSTTTVENADGSSSESIVKTKADGSASSTLTETDAKGNVSVTVGSKKTDGSEISKSYAVEDDGVVLTAVEATTASASIPATVKVNGKSVPVTTVGEGAMKDNTSVKKVTLAESITSIGEDAFSGAKNLKTIKLSANITEIAPGAFDGIKSNATFYISAATDEEFDALVELLKKSGVGSKVKFKRA